MNYRYFIEKVANADSLGLFSVSVEVKDAASLLLNNWSHEKAKEFVLALLNPEKWSWRVSQDVRDEAHMIS